MTNQTPKQIFQSWQEGLLGNNEALRVLVGMIDHDPVTRIDFMRQIVADEDRILAAKKRVDFQEYLAETNLNHHKIRDEVVAAIMFAYDGGKVAWQRGDDLRFIL